MLKRGRKGIGENEVGARGIGTAMHEIDDNEKAKKPVLSVIGKRGEAKQWKATEGGKGSKSGGTAPSRCRAATGLERNFATVATGKLQERS